MSDVKLLISNEYYYSMFLLKSALEATMISVQLVSKWSARPRRSKHIHPTVCIMATYLLDCVEPLTFEPACP